MAYAHLVSQIALGISLSACAGLRAFLPLLVMGIFQRLGYIQVNPAFQWIGSTPSLVIFGTATFAEILGDKLPVVDNALDTMETFVKPVVGTILFATAIVKMSPMLAVVLGLIAGGSISEVIHFKKAAIRGGSTTLTAGVANPVLSFIEDITTAAGTALSFLAPLIAACIALIVLLIAFHIFKKVFHQRKAQHEAEMAEV